MQDLIGASRSNDLGSIKYIINHAKNLDINVRESDKVSVIECIALFYFKCMIFFILVRLEFLDVGHRKK